MAPDSMLMETISEEERPPEDGETLTDDELPHNWRVTERTETETLIEARYAPLGFAITRWDDAWLVSHFETVEGERTTTFQLQTPFTTRAEAEIAAAGLIAGFEQAFE